MTIQTEIMLADYQAFSRNVVQASTLHPVARLIVFAALISLPFVAVALVGDKDRFLDLAVGFSVGFFGVVIISRLRMKKFVPAPDGTILGRKTLTVSSDGMTQIGEHGQAFFQWSAVRSLRVTKDHIFVMIDNVAGFFVPRRSFGSEDEERQFLREIEGWSGVSSS